MAIHDIKTKLLNLLAGFFAVSGNGDVTGAIIDTAKFELGLMFSVAVTAYTDGTHNVRVFHSDDSGMAGATEITDAEKIIGSLTDVQGLTAANSNGDTLPSIGIIDNKRYVRITVTSTGVTTGADLAVVCTQKGEEMPV